jgi:WD40 repeat protein
VAVCDHKDSSGQCAIKSVKVLDTQSEREISKIVNDAQITYLLFSPDGRRIVTVGCDQIKNDSSGCQKSSIYVWNPNNGRVITRIFEEGNFENIRFNQDGKLIAGNNNGTVKIYSTTSGKVHYTSTENNISNFDISPDGKYLVTGNGKTITVWSIPSGESMAHMFLDKIGASSNIFPPMVRSVTFSPDGKYIVSRGDDKVVRVWSWKLEDLISEVCRRIETNFTYDEWRNLMGENVEYRKTCDNLPIPNDTQEP